MRKKIKRQLSSEKDMADFNEQLKRNMTTTPTGHCWCGCGERADNFFVQAHDGSALKYLKALGYKDELIANRVLRAGFDPTTNLLKKEWERKTGGR